MSRIAVCALLFGASCLLVVQRTEPVGAQEKKDKKDTPTVASLEKQVSALEKQLKAAQQEFNQAAQQYNAIKNDALQLKNQNAKLQAENNRLEAVIKKEKIDDGKDDKALKALQTAIDGYRGAGLVHVVVLKLKTDSPTTEPQLLIDETYSQLSKIKTVRGVWAGKPSAKSTTAEAAPDYTVALVFLFDDAAGLKTYLNDTVHTKFADKHLKKWEAPVVYDFESKKPAP